MGGGATFARYKVYTTEILMPADLNGTLNNILDNLDPTGIGDQSDDVATMQIQTDPYPGATESKATSLAGELYRKRYMLAQLSGQTYWYEDPLASLASLFAGEHKLVSKTTTYTALVTDGIILCDASGGAFTVTLPVVSGNGGKIYFLKKTDTSANILTIDGNGAETINGLLQHYLRTQNDYVMLCCNGTAWYTLSESQRANILEYQDLRVVSNSSNPTYQVDIDADGLDLETSTGVIHRAKSVNLTADLSTSGANGLDTGAEAANTSYALWVIYDPTTNTVASLLSTSFTLGGITLPTNYTFGRLVGFCRNNSGSNLLLFNQFNDQLLYDAPEDDTQVLTTGTDTSFTDVDITNFGGNSALVKQVIISANAYATTDGATYYARVRPNGSAATNGKMIALLRRDVSGNNYAQYQVVEFTIALDSSLIFEYKATTNMTVNMWVAGLKLNI